jgi:hypothetical protein
MNKLYTFCGGRKLFIFFFMYISQYVMACYGKWSDGFGYAAVGLYGVIVMGIEYNKKGKKRAESENNDCN